MGALIMSSMEISWIVFGCVFAGALLGMLLRATLPVQHQSADSKDVLKLLAGLIGTMSALVIGLLIARQPVRSLRGAANSRKWRSILFCSTGD
jgi:hypothetical protein